MTSRLCLCFAIWNALAAPLGAQGTPVDALVRAGTQEVLLDFVARDKHQKAITDLRPEEVQIYEDGAPQHVRSFMYRDGSGNAGGVGSVARSAPQYDALREMNLVSIVFESMGPQSRHRAMQFLSEFLDTGISANTWIGVFTLNHQLSVIQPYTTELPLVRKALDHAGTGAYQNFAQESAEILKRINSLQASLQTSKSATFQTLSPGSAEERGPAGGIGRELAARETAIQQLTLQTLSQQAGSRTIDALRRLVRVQQQLPGRKTVLYVAEGLVVPPAQPELLQSVIGEANRGNITFYTLDARGLDTASPVKLAGMANDAVNAAPPGGDIAVQQTNLQENARQLAQGTGGFAMDNSNDLRGPLRRLMEDVRAHYELTYSPTATNFDGHFRAIEVKVTRPGIRIQSRKGYFALPLLNGETISLLDTAGLRALDAKPAPHAFDFHVAALRFPSAGAAASDYRIVISVPARALRFTEDPVAKTFRVHVAALVLVKAVPDGPDGGEPQVVERLSRDLPFQAPVARRAEFEMGAVTMLVPVRLAAGRYRIEAALVDAEGAVASVRRSVLLVPGALPQAQLDVSDFVWVHAVRPSAANETRDAGDPLDTEQGRITPELEPVFSAAAGAPFFFLAIPREDDTAAVTARIALSRDGVPMGVFEPALPAPSTDSNGGRIAFLGQLPLAQLSSGDYDVVFTLRQGSQSVSRQTRLTVR